MAPAPAAAHDTRLHILLIEDDEALRYALARYLRARGLRVTEAATGELGLDADRHDPADLVLLDVMLPTGTGVDVALALKARRPAMPIVAVTGRAIDLTWDWPSLVLAKPIGPLSLYAAMQPLLHALRANLPPAA